MTLTGRLGGLLRFRRPSQSSADTAIARLEASLAGIPPGHPDRAGLVSLLAQACWQRYGGDDSDYAAVDRMTRYTQEAWTLLPPGGEGTFTREVAGLYCATGIYGQFWRPGEPVDMDQVSLAIDMFLDGEKTEMARQPDVHPALLTMLSVLLATRAEALGSPSAVQEARKWVHQALDEVPLEDPDYAGETWLLAISLAQLSVLSQLNEDTDRAIEVLTSIAGPSDDPGGQNRAMLGGLLVQRGSGKQDDHDLDAGIRYLQEAWELMPDGSASRPAAVQNLASALLSRYHLRRDGQDLDAAGFYLSTFQTLAGPAGGLPADTAALLSALHAKLRLTQAMAAQDVTAAEDGVRHAREALAALPAGHPHRAQVQSDLGTGLVLRLAFGGGSEQDAEEALLMHRAAVEQAGRGDLPRPVILLQQAVTLAWIGEMRGNREYLARAVAEGMAALDALGPRFGQRARFTTLLGVAQWHLYELTGDAAALAAAAGLLQDTRQALSGQPGHPLLATCLMSLARCYRAQGEAGLAERAGQDALRHRSHELLLQTGTAQGLRIARAARDEAVQVAAWSVMDSKAEAAAEALERGRGLILHSATVVTGVSEMLSEAGHAELAGEWRAALAGSSGRPWDEPGWPGHWLGPQDDGAVLEIPSDLRRRVLDALAGPVADRLLASPRCADIAAALTSTGSDALVYLMESAATGTGVAIIVPARSDAGTELLPLPRLAAGLATELADYIQADQALGTGSGNGAAGQAAARERWSQALERLCDWAWPAALEPLLSRLSTVTDSRLPRIVLVPVGRLSLVPWHAARSTPAGPDRYACARVVISYAASGRQLVEVSKRPALAVHSDPAVVGDPAADLAFGALEAHFIRARCYPGGRYLGRAVPLPGARSDGPGRPAEVLGELPAAARPGASVLHLGCHARLAADAPGQSYLELADGQLAIEAILRQASQRPATAAGGLVCLAACSSAHGGSAHDEALSLSTAFLAAGATSVIGARWEVPSGVTSVLMFMFHYFLAIDGQEPRDALRSAQLWLLDPERAVPAQLPGELARFLPGPASLSVADWAAFSHHGH
jgi:hypothetical protein